MPGYSITLFSPPQTLLFTGEETDFGYCVTSLGFVLVMSLMFLIHIATLSSGKCFKVFFKMLLEITGNPLFQVNPPLQERLQSPIFYWPVNICFPLMFIQPSWSFNHLVLPGSKVSFDADSDPGGTPKTQYRPGLTVLKHSFISFPWVGFLGTSINLPKSLFPYKMRRIIPT